jgi:hypothetical protein
VGGGRGCRTRGAGAREIAVEVVDDEDELMVFVEAAVSGAEALMPRRRAQVRVPHSRARARGQEPFVAENSQLATEVAVAGNQKCRRRQQAAPESAGDGRNRRRLGFRLVASAGEFNHTGGRKTMEESELERSRRPAADSAGSAGSAAGGGLVA